VGVFIVKSLEFLFVENPLGMELKDSWAYWWDLGACARDSHPHGGVKNYNLMLSLVEGSLE
jgi:hypothetical protein